MSFLDRLIHWTKSPTAATLAAAHRATLNTDIERGQCGTPDPEPEPKPTPPRRWKIREGHGFTIGTATEITNTLTGDKLIQVTWEDDLVPPMRRPYRKTWIDIAALDNSLNNTHPDGFRRRHKITGPVRIQWISRGDWHEDVAMDEDD